MKLAEIISVGDEVLGGLIADTNAQEIGRMLPDLGIEHRWRQTVGDRPDEIAEAIRLALSRSDFVFTIGGLGPTLDDATRDGISQACDAPLELVPAVEEKLRRLFAQRGIPWVESQTRQAHRPRGAELLDNPNGSAPGLWLPLGDKAVIALPGPRGEFLPMLHGPVRERLAAASGETISSRLLKVCELGESVIEEMLMDLIQAQNPTLAPYAKPGEVHLRLLARGEGAEGLLEKAEATIRERLSDRVFGGAEDTLESCVLGLLAAKGQKLAVAESITGGSIAGRLTSVPGASKTFLGGLIAYTAAAKQALLGVREETLARFSPVSAEVCAEMAVGARERLQADYALAVTGNAGPTSDEGGRPVGLAYAAVAGPEGVESIEVKFRGDRAAIRFRVEQAALTFLRRRLL